jgi:hypothetical protein
MLAREYLRQKFRLLCIVAKNDKTWCGGKRVLLFEDVFLSQNPPRATMLRRSIRRRPTFRVQDAMQTHDVVALPLES